MELKNGLSSPPCYLLVHMPLGLNCVGRRMVSVSFKPLQVLTAENSPDNCRTVPYPFLTQNPFPIRLAIYGGATTIGGLSFLAMNTLHP